MFSRSWIAASLIKLWDEDVDRSGGNKEEAWLKGMEEAEEAATLTNEERLALLVVDRVEEDDVDDEEGQVEEKPLESKRKREKTRLSVNKRRRIVRPADQGCIFFPKIEFFINHYLEALSFL